jgi:hypothetical protein
MLRSFPAPKKRGGYVNATGDFPFACEVKPRRKVTNMVTLVTSASNRADRKDTVTIKALATGVLAVAIIGAAAAGVTSVAPVGPTAAPHVQLVVFGASLPLDPAGAVPTPNQLLGVLNGLQAPIR